MRYFFIFFLFLHPALAGMLCEPGNLTGCFKLYEYVPLHGKEYIPVVWAYVKKPSIRLHSGYGDINKLENHLDKQFINYAAQIADDDEFIRYMRESGEELNNLVVTYRVHIDRNYTDFPYRDFTYVYRFLFLPSSSFIVMRRVVFAGYSYPTTDPDQFRLSKGLLEKSDTSTVILRTGVDFWKDYIDFLNSGGQKTPLEYFRDWHRLPKRVRDVSLPSVFFVKNGQISVLRGKVTYWTGNYTEKQLEKIKIPEDEVLTAENGTVLVSVPKGTTLKQVMDVFRSSLSANGKYTNVENFLVRMACKTLLFYNSDATYCFNFDTGTAYVAEPDGVHAYSIVYAATPSVLRWKEEGDEHYYTYGMTDPTKVYWNEPLRNAIVIPERVACLYYAGKNCRRFKKYLPAAKHEARYYPLRWYVRLLHKLGVKYIFSKERSLIIPALLDAVWSWNLQVPEYLPEDLEKGMKLIGNKILLASRTYAEENYILTCNKRTGKPEALLVIPQEYKQYGEQVGQILKTQGLLSVYYDATTRIPIAELTCEEVKGYAKEHSRTVFTLDAPPPPPAFESRMEDYVTTIDNTTMNFNPATGGGGTVGGQ